MRLANLIFWVSGGILVYTYLVYGLLLYFINKVKVNFYSPITPRALLEPEVTLIVPVYNEAEFLEAKIDNTFNLKYPDYKLHIIFITDGSTDISNQIIEKYAGINLMFEDERKGKMAAINRAMTRVTSPVVIFSDANTMLNEDCIKIIVTQYNDAKVGGVAGEKKIGDTKNDNIGFGEGLYWRYESKMKQLDSDFNTVVGAAGELFSIKTALFEPQSATVILDDFILSMKICLKGYKVAYAPAAFATETPSAGLLQEMKRKVRIAAGSFQSLYLLRPLWNVFKHPRLTFQYFSRRICRWILSPLALPALFISNACLVYQKAGLSFTVLFLFQCIFYLFVVAGWLCFRYKITARGVVVPFYFVFMNVCMVLGFVRYFRGTQPAAWDKAYRTKHN